MKKHMLEITVFFCGAVVMIYEIVGSRVVAPYFGTSIYVWTSLIGVILASLSLGYWLGGKLADKNPTYRQLAYIIFGSAMFIIVSVTLKDLILNFLSGSFNGMMWRSLFAAVLIFAPASIFLGMVSPYAVRLKIRDVKSSGKTVGNLYAISTIGSILGTFLAGFLLIPLIGTANIMYSLAALLSVLAFTLYVAFMGKGDSIFFFIVFIAAGYGLYEENTLTKEFVEADTRYNHVQIFDMDYWITGERIKVMKVNDEYSSAMFPDSDSLVYEYLRYFRLAEHFNPGFRNALMIGGAAFSYPRYFLDRYPDANIDVVEIDPGLTRLAKEHFRLLENARMRIFHEDGRTFLNRQEGKYDLILGDAYKSLLAVPFQLTTLEATKRKFDLLSDDGIVIENIIASLDGPASAFLKAEIATIRKIFPQVYIFACHDPLDPQLLQSITLVALKSGEMPRFVSKEAQLNEYLSHWVDIEIPPGTMILTDDYAPVEYFAHKAF